MSEKFEVSDHGGCPKMKSGIVGVRIAPSTTGAGARKTKYCRLTNTGVTVGY